MDWFTPSVTPDFRVRNSIVIRSGHIVKVTKSVTTDKTFIQPNGSLVITGAILSVLNRGLTVQSNSSGTARIGTSTGSINGAVTIERYVVPKSVRRFSFVTAPVTARIDTTWQKQLHITGSAIGTQGTPCTDGDANKQPTTHANGFDATATNAASMYRYDQTLTTGNKFISIMGTNASTSITDGSNLFARAMVTG